MTVTVCITCSDDRGDRFDWHYYLEEHLPLVRRSWERHGLLAVQVLRPAAIGGGLLAVAVCAFRDEEAVAASFDGFESAAVMADLARYTDAVAVQQRGLPL